MDIEDNSPRRSGTRIVFYLALIIVLAAAGAYVYATNHHGLRDVVTSVRDAVELAPGPGPEVERLTRRIADLELRSAVRDALDQQPELGGPALRVAVQDAVVTLAGTVPASGWKYAAERLIGEVEGVVRINNAITVHTTEAEPGEADGDAVDRRLARRVEFELYATDAFDLEGIEVAAAGGEIRLGGTVRSLAERLLAERVASEVEGVGTLTNDLQIATPAAPASDLS